MIGAVTFKMNEHLYLKNPEETDLGRRIIKGSVDLFHEAGIEHFTFKKLAAEIGSTEASVYRYFESKHKLLLYLVSWYWNWMRWNLTISSMNIEEPKAKLLSAINLFVQPTAIDHRIQFVDEKKLSQIVICEGSKVYLTKEVDDENKEGLFSPYKELVGDLAQLVLDVNPEYEYPHTLMSSFIESLNHQKFFADHLPRLTNSSDGLELQPFYIDLIFKIIQ